MKAKKTEVGTEDNKPAEVTDAEAGSKASKNKKKKDKAKAAKATKASGVVEGNWHRWLEMIKFIICFMNKIVFLIFLSI